MTGNDPRVRLVGDARGVVGRDDLGERSSLPTEPVGTGRLTHASFFSGVGGLDLGLERAGWRTVSFSEVDPYASAVLAERWPGVPNLGDITALDTQVDESGSGTEDGFRHREDRRPESIAGRGQPDWRGARLWSGGFPCQDLSVAGKRRGLAGERSGLAFAFLDLVGRHRPECVLLENVPGLLSSHRGKDLGTLLGALGELRYGWAFRVLDAQWFGVPQRRRRVFILALDLERHPDERSAGEVLAVGSRCGRDHPAERAAWARAAGTAGDGVAGTLGAHDFKGPGHNRDDRLVLSQSVNAKWAKGYSGPAGDEHHNLVVDGAPTHAGRVRTPPGLAGRLDDSPLVASVGSGNGGPDDNDVRSGHLVFDPTAGRDMRAYSDGAPAVVGHSEVGGDDPLLPVSLDSHRYRCVGNGVAAPVAEWVGRRLARYLAARQEAA